MRVGKVGVGDTHSYVAAGDVDTTRGGLHDDITADNGRPIDDHHRHHAAADDTYQHHDDDLATQQRPAP